MKKTFTLLIALFALCVSTWATPTTITWNAENGLTSIDLNEYTNIYYSDAYHSYNDGTKAAIIEGIAATISATADGSSASFYTYENSTSISLSDGGTLTFYSGLYEIQSIVINYDGDNGGYGSVDNPTEWSSSYTDATLTWTGSATHSVVLANAYVSKITSIVFTVEAIQTTSVTWVQTDIETITLYSNEVDAVATSSAISGITASLKRTSAGQNTYCQFSDRELWINDCGEITFTSSIGDIVGIVITSDYVYTSTYNLSTGWTYNDVAKTLTWTGTASDEVTLSGSMDFKVLSIEFTLTEGAAPVDPTPTTTTIEWDNTDLESIGMACNNAGDVVAVSAIDGISASLTMTNSGQYTYCRIYENGLWISKSCGYLTFSSSIGDISGIVITYDKTYQYHTLSALSTGWTDNNTAGTITWAGTAAEQVTITGDIDIKMTSIEFTVVPNSAPVDPDPTPTLITSTVTWDQNDVESIEAIPDHPYVGVPGYQVLKGISVTANAPQSGDNCHFMTAYNNTSISAENGGTVSFAPLAGKLTKIVITCTGYVNYNDLSSAWTWNESTKELTWSGNATQSVALACEGSSGYIFFGEIYSIEFTVVTEEAPANPFIIWEQRQVNHVELNSYTKDYIDAAPVIRNIIATLTRTNSNEGNCLFDGGRIAIGGCGELEFKSIVGELSSIVITCSSVTSASDLSTDWTYNSGAKTITWEGTAAEEVTLSGDIDCKVTSIKFFYTPADAPRLGEQFQGIYDQLYQITGAQTAMMPVQQITHTLEVPETVYYEGVTYYVTEVADNAFKNNKLPNAYIGANVGRIGAHAFEGCTIMSDISIYSHVVDEIGEQAYKDCKLMQIFECYTKQPPVLGSNAFDGDGRINHILVQYDTEDAYKSADGWSNLADKVEEMSNAPYIGEIFFFNNQKTVNLYQVLALPDYFTSTNGQAKVVPYTAEVNAIYPRTLERTLVVPEEVSYVAGMKYSVTGVGANAYKNCTEVEVVLFPEGVTSIEAGAFAGCTGVKNVFFLWKDPTIVTWADANEGAEFATAASGKTKIIVPKDKLAEYQEWAPAWASCMVAGEIEDVEATKDPNSYGTSARYYRTFYDSTKDYMLPPSVWAHAGYVRGNEFILHPVAFDGEILPKGTAVVLESETAEYRLIAMENSSVPAYTGPNDLVGLDVAQTVSYVADSLNITAEQIYVLNRRATVGGELQVGMGMYRYTGTTLGAKKAFMVLRNPVDTGTSNDQPAPGRFLFRHEDTATNFENVQTDNDLCTKILRDGQLIIIRDGKEYNAQGMIIK